jgi:hypothetical protein
MPTVSGLADASVQKKINDALAVKIKGVKDDFVSQAVNTKLAAGPSTKSFLQVEFKSFTVTKNSVLALRFETASYFSGAAHPIEFSMVSNFDLKTAHEFELIDLFDTSSVEYLHVISDFSTKALKTQLAAEQNVSVDSPDLQFFPEGATSNPENFSVFMVEDGGIRFIFGQYQVAPYVMGEQEVLIPYSVLAKYMKKGELMDALVK